MNSTAIVYRAFPAEASGRAATVIILHDAGGDIDSAVPLRETLPKSFDLMAPQAWRPINARPLSAADYQGYAWYFEYSPQHPEPATFGDSLWQIEQFIGELRERPIKGPLVLFGIGQGGVLALTLAMVVPDLVDGVAAVNGFVPAIRGWTPPRLPLRGLPILAMTHGSDLPPAILNRSVDGLRDRGGDVIVRALGAQRGAEVESAAAVNAWMSSYDVSTQPDRVAALTGQPHHLNPEVLDV